MKNCINCNHSLDINVKFCPECGTKQPDVSMENQTPSYSASIGDKNVISGNIIGKSEEFNISGPATINKIEDETKKFIICAVSGRHLLRGRDIVVNCPKCKSDVADDCFNQFAKRCLNCDEIAYSHYSKKIDTILDDGIIDATERIQLDDLALSLIIDTSSKFRLESEAKERKAYNNLTTPGGYSNELSVFYNIQFKKATALVYEENDLSSAISLLLSIHSGNVLHDETAYLYFLIKAVHTPNEYVEKYENKDPRAIDVYWEDYWAFIPYIKLGDIGKGLNIISHNKSRFSANKDDILISEILANLMLFSYDKNIEYIEEARSLYMQCNGKSKQPLVQLNEFIGKIMNNHDSEWEKGAGDYGKFGNFYFSYFLNGQNKSVIEHKNGNVNTYVVKDTNSNADINAVKIGGQVWMAENLNVDRFRNGDIIPEVKTNADWEEYGKKGKPAWCYRNNDPANGEKFGRLYNWYAISDPRCLAPVGWHVATLDDFDTLTEHLGGYDYAGIKLKNTTGWIENGNGTNESGFAGLPGGYRGMGETSSGEGNIFFSEGENEGGYWWFFDDERENSSQGEYYYLVADEDSFEYNDLPKGWGLSVRSVMDEAQITESKVPIQENIIKDKFVVDKTSKEKDKINLNIVIDDEYIKVVQLSEFKFSIIFTNTFLRRLDFNFNISNDKIILNPKKTPILIKQYASVLSAIKLIEAEKWAEHNVTEMRQLNLGTGSNLLNLDIPNSSGQFHYDWKKRLLSANDDNDIHIVIERYVNSSFGFDFNLSIGKYSRKYRLGFGEYSIGSKLDNNLI